MPDAGRFWVDRPTFVTGATGLIGGWLVRALLEQKADVVCLIRDDNPRCELIRGGQIHQVRVVRGDVCDQALLERSLGEYEIRTVFHVAAQTIVGIANRNPVSTFDTNIRGTWALLEACRRSPLVKQVVVASSDKAYGEHKKLPYDEDAPLQGRHPYDVSKSCADLLAQCYAQSFNLPVTVTRCGNFYGGGDLNFNRIVPGTIRSVIREEPPIIRSDGTFIRDYFYAEDGAAAYMHLAECMARMPNVLGHAFNFSTEIQVTALELVQRIISLMGSKLAPVIKNEATNEIRHQYLNAQKARAMLNWRPLYSMDVGLNRTIDWYRRYFTEAQA